MYTRSPKSSKLTRWRSSGPKKLESQIFTLEIFYCRIWVEVGPELRAMLGSWLSAWCSCLWLLPSYFSRDWKASPFYLNQSETPPPPSSPHKLTERKEVLWGVNILCPIGALMNPAGESVCWSQLSSFFSRGHWRFSSSEISVVPGEPKLLPRDGQKFWAECPFVYEGKE